MVADERMLELNKNVVGDKERRRRAAHFVSSKNNTAKMKIMKI
jgi:hypothetical protein